MPPFRSARGLGETAPASSPCWPSKWARAMPPSPPPKRQRNSRRQTSPGLCAPVGEQGDAKLIFINSVLYLLVKHGAACGLDGGRLISRGGSPPAVPNATRESIRGKTIFMRSIHFKLEQTPRI